MNVSFLKTDHSFEWNTSINMNLERHISHRKTSPLSLGEGTIAFIVHLLRFISNCILDI